VQDFASFLDCETISSKTYQELEDVIDFPLLTGKTKTFVT